MRAICIVGLFVAALNAPGSASAQANPCAVKLVRAPDEVADAIQRRIAALGACNQRLDVWIVRTMDGLYVVAQDGLGRVRERGVPDVEVAAALIASWVELADVPDLAAPAPLAPPLPAPMSAAQVSPPGRPLAALTVRRTGSLESPTDLDDAPALAGYRTFAVGAHLGVTWDGDTTSGAHLELETLRHRAWFAAVDGVLVQEVAESYYVIDQPPRMSQFNEIGRTGVDAMVRAGVHVGRAAYLRPSAAVGVGVSRHEILVTEASAAIGGPVASTYTDWSVGLRLGVGLTAGIQLGRYALELNLAEVTGLQRAKPGVSDDDRMLSAGLGLRFHR